MRLGLWALALLVGCSDETPGRTALFDLEGSIAEPETFWNLPFPSDLRLAARGAPDMTGFPEPAQRADPRTRCSRRRRAPRLAGDADRVLPVHRAGPRARSITDVIPAERDAPSLLIDIDPASPERGTTYPARRGDARRSTTTSPSARRDRAAPRHRAAREHAVRVRVRSAFAPGFAAPIAFAALADGKTPTVHAARGSGRSTRRCGPRSTRAGIPTTTCWSRPCSRPATRSRVLRARSEAMRAAHQPTIDGPHARRRHDVRRVLRAARHDHDAAVPARHAAVRHRRPVRPRRRRRPDASRATMTIPLAITIPKRDDAGERLAALAVLPRLRRRVVRSRRSRATRRRPRDGPSSARVRATSSRGTASRRRRPRCRSTPSACRARATTRTSTSTTSRRSRTRSSRACSSSACSSTRCSSSRFPQRTLAGCGVAPAQRRAPLRRRQARSPAVSRWAACTRT